MALRQKRNRYEEYIEFAQNFGAIEFVSPVIHPVFYDEPEPAPAVPEERFDPFEPKTLEEFVGQENAREILKIIVDSANKEKRLIPNILLTGAYGHGKTTLAKLIAKRHRKEIQIIDGSVAGLMVKPDSNKIYIIDEAHNIPSQVTDSFNILIDANQLRIIACTTNPGALPAPFRSRFRLIYLEEYNPREIAKIIERALKRLTLHAEKEAITEIANRSKCNPRHALTILDFAREVSVVKKASVISHSLANEALTKLGIDGAGLTLIDRKYLELLGDHPVGLQYISSILSVDSDTVQQEIEPHLMKLGLVERTPRGRLKVGSLRSPIDIPDNLLEELRQSLEGL